MKITYRPRIRVTLLTLFLLLVITSTGCIIFINHRISTEAYREDAIRDIGHTHDFIESRITTFLYPVNNLLHYFQKHFNELDPEKNSIDSFKKKYLSVLLALPQFRGIGIGTPSGDIYYVSKVPPHTKGAPKEAVFYLYGCSQGLTCTEEYLDINGGTIPPYPKSKIDIIDARTRPWFEEAREKREQIWTEPYTYTNGDRGISSAMPLFTEGKLKGVAFIDLTLDELAGFLAEIPLGTHSFAAILDSEGNYVVKGPSSNSARYYQQTQNRELLPTLSQALLNLGHLEQAKTINHKNLLINFSSIQKLFENNWYFCLAIPETDFIGNVKEASTKVIGFSLIFVAIAIILSVVFARSLARPILGLSEEMLLIKDFNLESSRHINSWVYEIDLMSQALDSMKKGLTAFGSYVPKRLVRKLLINGEQAKIGGRKKALTILFTDVYDFTSISEKRPIDEVFPLLSEYLALITDEIEESKGTIDKFMGDGVLAFWGAPDQIKNSTKTACHSVLKCKAKVQQLNEEWQKKGLPPFHTRFALNYGESLVGNVGSPSRMNYTVMGDTVNTCARLESLNKNFQTTIIVSQPVYERTKDQFLYRTIDFVALKGKKEGTKVYELLAGYEAEAAIQPSEEDKKLSALSETGFEAYLQKDWQGAKAAYQEIKTLFPTDVTAEIFLARIEQFEKEPPPEDWQGLFILHTK